MMTPERIVVAVLALVVVIGFIVVYISYYRFVLNL